MLWEEGLTRLFGYVPDESFANYKRCGIARRSACTAFFGSERSDRIVPQSSQAGGVSGSGQYSNIQGVDHTTIHHNQSVVDIVRELLEADSKDTGQFIQVLPRAP